MSGKTLLKADSTSLQLAADKEGRIRVNANAMAEPAVVLLGQVLEVKWEHGQAVVRVSAAKTSWPRITDTYTETTKPEFVTGLKL